MYNPYGNGGQAQQQQQQQQPLYGQPTGYVNNWSTQAQPQQQQQQQPLYGQPTGYVNNWSTQAQPPQQQQQPLASQATGYYGGQVAPPTTSFGQAPAQAQPQLTSQPTGFQPSSSFGMNLAAQVTGWNPQAQQQQQQQQQAQASVPQPLMSQPTGFTSAYNNMSEQLVENKDLKIPNIRLSFISAHDQEKFEHLFRANVTSGENSITGAKAREILMKSNLKPTQLADIWALSDTTRSGHLLFPEFALALHLCNIAINGQPIPLELPIKMKNEVTSFVDTISFAVDDTPSNSNGHSVPDNTPFTQDARFQQQQQQAPPPVTSFGFPGIQPQATGYPGLQPQATGYPGLQPQATGYVPQTQPQVPIRPQATGYVQPQATGYPGLQPQATGYQPQPQPQQQQQQSLQPQATGFNFSASSLQPQKTGTFTPLTAQQTSGFVPIGAQKTGGGLIPQQTGFQPQPTGLQPQPTGLVPQPTGLIPMPTGKPGQWGFVSTPTGGLPGLDMMQSHFLPGADTQSHQLNSLMGGNTASNVTWAITKQEKMIYDNIFKKWDTTRKGFVDGETAIGVFSKSGLARQDLEKIWTLSDLGNRGKLNRDEFAVAMHLVYRRLNGFDIPAYLPPELVPPSSKVLQDTMSSLKGSLRNDITSAKKSTGAKGYTGKTDGTRFKNDDADIGYVSNSRHKSRQSEADDISSSDIKLSVADLKKLIHEKRILLEAVDAKDEEISTNFVEQKISNDIEFLKTKIRATQKSINDKISSSSSSGLSSDDIQQKHELTNKLNSLTDKVPNVISLLNKIDDDIKTNKIELYRIKLSKENPAGIEIRGTGPNGTVTEADKRIAKQKAQLQARVAAFTGKQAPNFEAFEDNEEKLNQYIHSLTDESTKQSQMIKDIQTSIEELSTGISSNLVIKNSSEVGFNKWENGQGVASPDVRSFIQILSDSKPKVTSSVPAPRSAPVSSTPAVPSAASSTSAVPVSVAAAAPIASPVSTSASPSYNSFTSAEDRARHIKEQAEKRMNERLAKLGIARGRSVASPASAPAQEVPKEVVPQPVPSPVEAPKERRAAPPPPAARQSTVSSTPTPVAQPVAKTEDEDASSDDDDFDAAEQAEFDRLMKLKREMEVKKAKKKADKEARLAKLRAEMEKLNDDSDDDEDATIPEPSVKKEVEATTAAPTASSIPPPVESKEPEHQQPVIHSNNPFSKMIQKEEQPASSTPATPNGYGSTNPFFKPDTTKPSFDARAAEAQRKAQRGHTEDDDDDGWGDDDKNSGSDFDDDDDVPSRNGGPSQLASLLFGGMRSQTSETAVPPVPTAAPVATPAPVSQAMPPIPGTQPAAPVAEVATSAAQAPPVPSAAQAPPVPSAEPVVPEASSSIPQAPPIPQGLNPVESERSSEDDDDEVSFADAQEQQSLNSSVLNVTEPVAPVVVPPIPTAPPIPAAPSGFAPPPPPVPSTFPVAQDGSSIPEAPPIPSSGAPVPAPPPPPPIPSTEAPSVSVPTPSAPALPNLQGLLSEISLGKSLKKVDDSEKHIVGGSVGKVLD